MSDEARRCDECGHYKAVHLFGCPWGMSVAFRLGDFERAPVDLCDECGWKDGYHKPGACSRDEGRIGVG